MIEEGKSDFANEIKKLLVEYNKTLAIPIIIIIDEAEITIDNDNIEGWRYLSNEKLATIELFKKSNWKVDVSYKHKY